MPSRSLRPRCSCSPRRRPTYCCASALEFLGEVSLVVVDEAHHIEDGTRGVLLELYLARLRSTLAAHARYVLLSAVAPNIREITDWIGDRPGYAVVEQRSTRMKVGIYKVRREGHFNQGFIDYTDGTRVLIFNRKAEKGQEAGLVQLAERLAAAGPLLVVAQGKKTTENIAAALHRAGQQRSWGTRVRQTQGAGACAAGLPA